MKLIHLSDLHLSRYGEGGGSTVKRVRTEDDRWFSLQSWERWQIEGCHDRKGRPEKLRLVDPDGMVHLVKRWRSRREELIVERFLERARQRQRTSTERLVASRPPPDELMALLAEDPLNTNLRFLKVIDEVMALAPEIIVVTGDLTNNGVGYELVLHYLRPWIDGRRFFAVPGNHDVYDMMPRLGRMARAAARVERYREFAEQAHLEVNPAGAFVRRIGDVAVVGLNSCKMPRTPLSASGAVAREQLIWLRELGHDTAFQGARLRLGLVHHHLLRMPFMLGKRTPFEVGMRLRNAVDVMEICTGARLNILLNGHRHHGYTVQLPGRPLVISAPSSTLGCKSLRQTYAWLLDLSLAHPVPAIHPLNGIPERYCSGRGRL